MQQRRERRSTELESGAPSTRHIAKTDSKQQKDAHRGEHHGEQRELDGLSGNRAPHLQHLLQLHRTERLLKPVLDSLLSRR